MSRPNRDAAGLELARLLLRLGIGGTMVAHGVKHARTLPGTSKWFDSIGFRQPELQARASAVVEIGGGTAVALGALTPLSAASVIGTMGVAARSVHIDNGFFITKEGYEYVTMIAVASAAASALGPGRYSVDRMLGSSWTAGGVRAAALSVGLGLAGAAAQLAAFWRAPKNL